MPLASVADVPARRVTLGAAVLSEVGRGLTAAPEDSPKAKACWYAQVVGLRPLGNSVPVGSLGGGQLALLCGPPAGHDIVCIHSMLQGASSFPLQWTSRFPGGLMEQHSPSHLLRRRCEWMDSAHLLICWEGGVNRWTALTSSSVEKEV